MAADEPARPAPAPTAGCPALGRRHVIGVFFLLPLVAMVEFTTRAPSGTAARSTSGGRWRTSVRSPSSTRTCSTARGLARAWSSLTVLLMLVLLVPTMIWVRLRLPWLRRPLEFVCLLPLTVPAIVLVVGLAPVYAWVAYFLGPSSLTLCFAYTVLVLPFAYRASTPGSPRSTSARSRRRRAAWAPAGSPSSPGSCCRTSGPRCSRRRSSPSRSCSASSPSPNLLSRTNVQVAINLLGKRDPSISVAVSLTALLVAFVLLLVLSLVGVRRRAAARAAVRPGRARRHTCREVS